MPDLGDTDLMEIHAVVTPADILAALEPHRDRYIATLGDVKKIYEAQTERYAEAYKEYTQKEINGELTETEKRAKPKEPQMPPDRTKTYDRYIALYKATRAENVYLAEQRFAEFFLDEWDFIRAHISHLRVLRAGGRGAFLDSDLSSIAASALTMYNP
ncbi:hypothetical protein ES703_45910 [subsurface metagenome]